MKKVLSAIVFCLGLSSQAAPDHVITDSVVTDTAKVLIDTASTSPFGLDVYLYSRYVWRGVGFGASPSVQAQMSYTTGGLMAACYVSKSLNGNAIGFANTSNVMLGYKYKGASLTVDDYFFYDEDNFDNYTDWGTETPHFIEGRLRYDADRWYAFAGYNVYAADGANRDAVYLEAGYRIPKHALSLFIGGLTDKSDLNFATSGGVTNIGVTKEKRLRFNDEHSLPVTGTLIVNPNYEHVVDLPRVTRSFLTLVIGTYF